MNTETNDYLKIENLVDYNHTYQELFIEVTVNINNNNNNNKFNDNSGDLYVKIIKTINDNSIVKDNKSYYYLMDSANSAAFGHWVYETLITINILRELNKNNDNIKILTKNDKKYVKNLLKFFNINNEIIHKIDNHNNITYLPLILSLNYIHKDPMKDYKDPEKNIYFNYHLDYYINYMKNNIINISSNNNGCIFLPRNDFDNYVRDYLPNKERIIVNKDKIKEIVINNGGVVLDTYHLNNIKYQISIINDFKTIILDYGSSVYFNCAFLENKNIYIIDNYGTFYQEIRDCPYTKYILEKFFSKNNIYFINSTQLELINNITKTD
jgi:hypothetical protein